MKSTFITISKDENKLNFNLKVKLKFLFSF